MPARRGTGMNTRVPPTIRSPSSDTESSCQTSLKPRAGWSGGRLAGWLLLLRASLILK